MPPFLLFGNTGLPSNNNPQGSLYFDEDGVIKLKTGSSTWTTIADSRSLKVTQVSDVSLIEPDADTHDIIHQTYTGTSTLSIDNPTGNPEDGQRLIFRIKSDNAESLSWDTQYRGSLNKLLPSSLTGSSRTDYFAFMFNEIDTNWDFLGQTAGF